MKNILILCGLGVGVVLSALAPMPAHAEDDVHFYVGAYTTRLGHVDGKAAGITLWTVNIKTGELKQTGGPWDIANASHLCLGKDKRFLYSISEITEYKGKRDGYLTQFSIDEETLMLTDLGTVSSNGPGPAYLSTDQTGKYLLLANYVNGNIIVYPIQKDGMLGEATANEMHEGSSVNPGRQEGPHPHALLASPDNKFVYSPDLGIDKIKTYAFDDTTGTLTPRPDLDVTTPPGSGPRHFEFHPSGRYAYVTLELSSQVAAYTYDNGALKQIGIYDMLPDDFKGESSSAEIRVSPNGRFVYASNRGHNSITAFAIDQNSGELERIQIISTEGEIPRNFALDPSGAVLVAGNQNSHTMISYTVHPETGILTATGHKAEALSPVLFRFY